ncbi:hypothetical protein RJ639_004886 [Escallonia herrerae]|uniref:Uncharacterized protein n=1 Tax=Escallonia herrerae TaxID=1293975 RepID=A0AA89AZ54_9ASTE|nr:hypothetical protein RJ639_004886 [Escallonia herrerae]
MTAACNCSPFIASTSILQPIKKSSNLTFQTPTARTLTLICSAEPENKSKPKPIKRRPMSGPTRRRSSYGTSRRSVLRKTLIQEQVEFTGPVSDDPVVAVIGGGMSGMLCALNLEKRGIRSTVFDTVYCSLGSLYFALGPWRYEGLHGLGGRMGTRIIDPRPLIFDHAAQFFTVSDPLFAELVDGWCKKGLVREWLGTTGELEAGGHFSPLPSSPPRYIGIHGMRPLADSLLTQTRLVNVVRPCWISALEPFNGTWHLSENGKPRGHFDAVVIAHNVATQAPLFIEFNLQAEEIFSCKYFGNSTMYEGRLVMQMCKSVACFIGFTTYCKTDEGRWNTSASITFEDPLTMPANAAAFPFEGAFVKGIDSLSWMANNTKKLLNSQSCGAHCWTFFSTSTFGKRNKVPHVSY